MPGPEDVTLPPAAPAAPLTLGDANATAGDAAAGGSAQPVASPGRYRIGEEIARGGMGVVCRAADAAFGREVAVKVLHEKFAPGSAAARRFADEARITAQLQHPNIPAVHDQGTLPDGRPFLAMKLIKGQTFDHQLAARPDPEHDRGRFVAVFEQVCQAVAYAHAHGVLHRDLKPANVMVGRFGEVQVMDWGLAKVLQSRDREGAEVDPAATTVETEVQSLRDGEFTQAGQALGTPAFMPPEQAVGAVGKVDARSDVFGLGAILAVILTGKPPFTGSSAETVRVRAAQGDVADCLARLGGCGAEPGLVELCRRCLSPKPTDRPADAGEVAREVARLRAEADERARRAELDRVEAESQARERRKRRRVWLAAAAAVALAVTGGLAAVLAVQRRANADLASANEGLEAANTDLAAERERVQRRFELAQKAIETFHTGVSEEALLKNDQLAALRKRLLSEAAGFYRELEGLLKDQQDERSREALASAYFKLASLTEQIGDKAEALEAHRRALEIRQKLAGDNPSVTAFQSDLAASHNNIGNLLRETGKPGEALEAYRRALAIQRKLAGDNPSVTEYQRDLAGSHNNIGNLLRETGKPGEALEACRQALAIRRKLAGDNPSVSKFHSDLAASHNSIGLLLRETGKPGEALEACRQALAIRRKLAGDNPSVTAFQSDLAASHNNIGKLLRETGKPGEALEAYRRALAIRQKLAGDNPAVTKYQIALANSCCNLGHLQRDGGKPEEALPLYQQAIDRLRPVLQAQPRHPTTRLSLRNSHWGRAEALERLKRHREAAGDWRQALALETGADRPTIQLQLAVCLARGGDQAGAARLGDEVAGDPAASGATLYDAACVQAVAAAVTDAGRPLPLREKAAEGYAARAVELLRQAQARGYFRDPKAVAHMGKDDDLTSLRSRADFQALLNELRATGAAGGWSPERLPMPRQQ